MEIPQNQKLWHEGAKLSEERVEIFRSQWVQFTIHFVYIQMIPLFTARCFIFGFFLLL